MKHYIYMQGIAGCIPAYCTATRTLAEAREQFVEMNDYCIDEDYRVSRSARRRAKLSLKVLAKENFPGTLYADGIDLYLPGEEDREATLSDVLANEVFEVYPCECDTPWVHEEDVDVFAIGEWLELLNKGARYEVNEWSSGFDVEDKHTGKTAWMGDGVDVELALPDCPFEFSLQKNGQYLAAVWTYLFNRDDEYVEAYFG